MTAVGHNGRTAPDLTRLGLSRVPMILMYHGVAEVASDPYHLCVTPARAHRVDERDEGPA